MRHVNCEIPVDRVFNEISSSQDQICSRSMKHHMRPSVEKQNLNRRRRDHHGELKKWHKRESKHRKENHHDSNLPTNICLVPEFRITSKKPMLSPILDESLYLVNNTDSFNISETEKNRKIFSTKNIAKRMNIMRCANTAMLNREDYSMMNKESHKENPGSSNFKQYRSFEQGSSVVKESNYKKIDKDKSNKKVKNHIMSKSKGRTKVREEILDEIVEDYIRNKIRPVVSAPKNSIFTPNKLKKEESLYFCQVPKGPRQRIRSIIYDEHYEPDIINERYERSSKKAVDVLNKKCLTTKRLRSKFKKILKNHSKPVHLTSKGTYSVLNKKQSPPKKKWMPHSKIIGVRYVSQYSMPPPPDFSNHNMKKRQKLQKKSSSHIDRSTTIDLRNQGRRFLNHQHYNTCSYGTHKRQSLSKIRRTSSSETDKPAQLQKYQFTSKKYEFNPTTKHLSNINKGTRAHLRNDFADEELDFVVQRESLKSAEINRRINNNYFNASQKSYMEFNRIQNEKCRDYNKIVSPSEQLMQHRQKVPKHKKYADVRSPQLDFCDNDCNSVGNNALSDLPLTNQPVSELKSTDKNTDEKGTGSPKAVKKFSEEIEDLQAENINNTTDCHSKCFRIENTNQIGSKSKNCNENNEKSKFPQKVENKRERCVHQTNKLGKNSFTCRRTQRSPKKSKSPKLITCSKDISDISLAPIWNGCAIDSRRFGPVAISLDELRNHMEKFASCAYLDQESEISNYEEENLLNKK